MSNNLKASARSWLGYLALAGLLALSIWLIQKADNSKPADWNESRLSYLPSAKILKPLAMDLDEGLADLLWIQGMIYFADAYLGGKGYQWMSHIMEIVSILNPRFKEAYEFSGVVLTKDKAVIPKTLLMLDRGITEFPMDWKLRLYAALAQLTLDSNFVVAAEYLKPITLNPDVPDYIRVIGATFLNQGGGRRVALTFLVDRYVKSENNINSEIFLTKILKLYPGNPSEENKRREVVIKVLEEARTNQASTMIALGVIHEFLTGNMSDRSKQLMELLYR
jgi:hypothetical protein